MKPKNMAKSTHHKVSNKPHFKFYFKLMNCLDLGAVKLLWKNVKLHP